MALGDSITLGTSSQSVNGTVSQVNVAGGYRARFYSDLQTAGFGFQFVGQSTVNPTTTLSNNNEAAHNGYAGIPIGRDIAPNGQELPEYGLYSNLTAATQAQMVNSGHSNYVSGDPYFGTSGASSMPGTVLLMAGTNNFLTGYGPNETINYMTALLTQMFAAYKTANVATPKVYLSTLLPYSGGTSFGQTTASIEANIEQFNGHTVNGDNYFPGTLTPSPRNVVELASYFNSQSGMAGSVTVVDAWSAFTLPANSGDMSPDGTHPNQAGYNLLGDLYANAVLSSVAAPEPTSALLLTITAGPLLLSRRRRLARAA